MSNNRTATYGTLPAVDKPARPTTTARSYPDEVARHAGEHPAFDPGFIDPVNRTIWFDFPHDHRACFCGLPARPDRLTCGSRLCMGAL